MNSSNNAPLSLPLSNPLERGSGGEVTIATLNLRGIHDRWWKREPLVVAGLARLDADIICLQEAATWCLQARWLAWRLSRQTGVRYHVSQKRKRGYRGIFEGLATLSKRPLSGSKTIPLGAEGRIGLLANVEVAGNRLPVANAHFDHHGAAGASREAQARMILGRVGSSDRAVVCGDLNDVPESAVLGVFADRMQPAHHLRGIEVIGTAPAWEPGRVIDYILVGADIEVLDAGVFLDTPVNGTWPSDHIGLWARLRI